VPLLDRRRLAVLVQPLPGVLAQRSQEPVVAGGRAVLDE
jgi:hypothetical protein